MKKELADLLEKSKTKRKLYGDLFKKLKKMPKNQVDVLFHEEHETTFRDVNCLDCANCCKTTSPIFTTTDIQRIAKLFRQKPNDFTDQYLFRDEDGDFVLKTAPCPFLQPDNTCFIYEHRPMACREYPHTNRKNMLQILPLTARNAEICPAVTVILNRIIAKKPDLQRKNGK